MNIDNLNLSTQERVYAGLGLLLMAISLILALIGYVVWPLFTGKSRVITNPVLHAASAAVGCVMSWQGLGRLIDHTLKQNLAYKVIRWLASKALLFAGAALTLVAFTVQAFASVIIQGFFDDEVESDSKFDDKEVDDIWEGHPQHYYDDDPPEPLS